MDWTYCCWNWKLKTENWKYCSKIIFKCVNSTVGPFFNEKVEICGSHKQYTGPTDSIIADKCVDVESGVGPLHSARDPLAAVFTCFWVKKKSKTQTQTQDSSQSKPHLYKKKPNQTQFSVFCACFYCFLFIFFISN